MAVLASGGIYLQDGFQEIFSFRGHKLHVRGIIPVEVNDHDRGFGLDSNSRRDQYVSWDVKSLLLWQDKKNGTPPEVVARYNFPKNQPQFISAVVYIPRMKVFVAAALDMTFKVFDKSFNVLQVLHHEERAILSLEYDNDYEKGIILAAGASGITVWRFYRNLSIGNEHVMEKMFTFDGFSQWVSSMIYEPRTHKIYALADRSVNVLSFKRRCVVTVLKDIHDAPVTRVCWYARSQFYLTGCSQGLIKCWTSHFRDVNKLQTMGQAVNAPTGKVVDDDDEVSSVRFALLHTFSCHSKAITGLVLHSTSGLAISTSMDGFMKVLNLEAFNELFSVNIGNGITGMKGISYGMHMACLFAQSNGRIRLWKVTSCCNFFGISAADVEVIDCFDSLHPDARKIDANLPPDLDEIEKELAPSFDGPENPPASAAELNSVENNRIEDIDGKDDHLFSDGDGDDTDSDESTLGTRSIDSKPLDSTGKKENKDLKLTVTEISPTIVNRLVVSYAGQDLRVYNRYGGLVCRVEPTEVVDGILSYTVSVYQELLFCLLHSGTIKVYCCRDPNSPLLKEVSVIKRTQSQGQTGTTICLIDCMPSSSVSLLGSSGHQPDGRPKTQRRSKQRTTIRHEGAPPAVDEILILGTSSGALMFLDTLNDLEVCTICQATQGTINTLKYRQTTKELFVMGQQTANGGVVIKVWKLPLLGVQSETTVLWNVTCFDISPTLSIFGVGCADGFVRLFNTPSIGEMCREIEKLGLVHDAEIVAISFCDELKIYATTSLDSTLKIWDLDKQLIRSIKFNLPPLAMKFHGNVGDIVICQRNYLLQCTMAIWNEGEYFQKMKEIYDPWQVDAEDDFDPEQLVNAISKKSGDCQDSSDTSKLKEFLPAELKLEQLASRQLVCRDPVSTGGIAIAPLLVPETNPSGTLDATITSTVEVATSVTFQIDGESLPEERNDVLDVHSPRFHIERKPPVRYKIPEIDDMLAEEVEKEERLIDTLRLARYRKSIVDNNGNLKSRLYFNPTTKPLATGKQYSESSETIDAQSLYVARTIASMGLSPRARMVLLDASEVVSLEPTAAEHVTNITAEYDNAAPDCGDRSIEEHQNFPVVPRAPTTEKPSAKRALMKFSGGRATMVVPRSLSEDPETSKIEVSISKALLPMQEAEILPGDLLLSQQYKKDRQAFRSRTARLRDPVHSLPVEPTDSEAETTSKFRRTLQSNGDKLQRETVQAALNNLKVKQETIRLKAIADEQKYKRQQQEVVGPPITGAELSLLAKLHAPMDHISQLLPTGHPERLNKVQSKATRKKSVVGGAIAILPATTVSAGSHATGEPTSSESNLVIYSASAINSRSDSIAGITKAPNTRKVSSSSHLFAKSQQPQQATDNPDPAISSEGLQENATVNAPQGPTWINESYSRATNILRASSKMGLKEPSAVNGFNTIEDLSTSPSTNKEYKSKTRSQMDRDSARHHAMQSFRLMGGMLGVAALEQKAAAAAAANGSELSKPNPSPVTKKIDMGFVAKILLHQKGNVQFEE